MTLSLKNPGYNPCPCDFYSGCEALASFVVTNADKVVSATEDRLLYHFVEWAKGARLDDEQRVFLESTGYDFDRKPASSKKRPKPEVHDLLTPERKKPITWDPEADNCHDLTGDD